MDYCKIYHKLVSRARERVLEGYQERHHVIPRCMGGQDAPDNLVCLTPEEHYVAHQLLVKIYPDNPHLIRAAQMMTVNRSTNKMYGWLRRRFSEVQSQLQSGQGNSQFGTKWIHSRELRKNRKISKRDPVPDEWELGRIINWQSYDRSIQRKKLIESKRIKKFLKQWKVNDSSLLYDRPRLARLILDRYIQSEHASLNQFVLAGEVSGSLQTVSSLFRDCLPGFSDLSTRSTVLDKNVLRQFLTNNT